MAVLDLAGLNRVIDTEKKVPVYFLYSPDEYLLDSFAQRLLRMLSATEE